MDHIAIPTDDQISDGLYGILALDLVKKIDKASRGAVTFDVKALYEHLRPHVAAGPVRHNFVKGWLERHATPREGTWRTPDNQCVLRRMLAAF
jgi:hypothetical protein